MLTPPPPHRPSPWRELRLGGLYFALAGLILWPLPLELRRALPLGTEDFGTVPMAMAFPFWWHADRLLVGFEGFWDAPIFSPTTGTFALSETNTLGSLLLAPVVLATGSAALGHNLFLWLSLALNGYLAHRLLRALGLHALASSVGGAAFVFLPLPLQEIGVLPLVPVWGILASYLALLRWTEAPSMQRGAVLGIALAATYLLCFQYALFLVILLVTFAPLLARRSAFRPAAVASLLLGAALSAAIVAPIVRGQTETVSEERYDRSRAKVEKLSCKPRHYARIPFPQWVPTPGIEVAGQAGWKAFWPGTTRVGLAVAGALWAVSLPALTRWGLFFTLGLVFAYAMSMGPFLRWGGFVPWELLGDLVPGYSKVRSVNRWAIFVQVHIVLLASLGLQSLLDRVVGRAPRGSDGGALAARGMQRWILRLSLTALAGAMIFEMTPPPQRLVRLPDPLMHAGWTEAVRTRTPPDAVLAFLPFSVGGEVDDYLPDARWMMLLPEFSRRMVNGYSSYFPAPFRGLKKALAQFPVGEGIEALRAAGVTHVVLDQAAYPEPLLMDYPTLREELVLLHRDDRAALDLYALRPARAETGAEP